MKPLARSALLLALALLARNATVAQTAPAKPNILVIVSDDHGYADVGFHGSKDIPTPSLDRLASEGVLCTNGYVTHPFCSPTRAALLTGRHQQRFGHENNPFYDPNDAKEGLPLGEKLLPEHLRAAGYVTGWIGKWHLGATPGHAPQSRGFAETFGFIGGGHQFLNWQTGPREYFIPLARNGRAVEVNEHLTTAFGREASAFIARNKDEPWFLYLAFNAPHTPNQPTPERLARFATIADEKRRAYAAQVSLLDDAIGETLAALRASERERATLVFFFSDNGGPLVPNGSLNTPLRGQKGQVYEGGVRVPYLLRWPGVLPAGKRYEEAVSAVDVFATALAAAGVPMPRERKYDSVNLLPYLRGQRRGAPHQYLYWRMGGGSAWAVRDARWKLVRRKGSPDELYDLRADLAESRDLAAAQPKETARLAAALAAWNGELIPPAFPGLSGRQPQNRPAVPPTNRP